MISNEQMDTLIGRLKVYGSESGCGKDHPNAITCRTAASVIIEQQAEIERLREALEGALEQMESDATMIEHEYGSPVKPFNEMLTNGILPSAYYAARKALGATQ